MSKVALVTGAASGIGLACAERLAADGMKVVLADLNETAGAGHAKRLGGTFVKADLASRAGCRSLVDAALKAYGTVHVLVNNAGYQHVAPIEDFPEEQWERMLALMLTAPFLLTRYCWPSMKQQKWGRVVNIASIHALVASPFKVAYISAKHGLVGLTKVVAIETANAGITCNAICPGWVLTALVQKQIDDRAKASGKSVREEEIALLSEKQPMHSFTKPESIGALAVFLASEAASAVNAQVFAIRKNEIFLMSQSRPLRSVHRADGWTPETCAEHLYPALKSGFYPATERTNDIFSWDPI